MMSVVIPAHDEERLIGGCLRALLESTDRDILDIVVVCDGCSDRTVEVASGFGDPVRVIETPSVGKAGALNLGDEAARGFPRVYLDADIELPTGTLAALGGSLARPGILAATTARRLDLSGSSRLVRRHYRARSRAPYPDHLAGRGVYALSEQGRRRFLEFPRLIADDLFVQAQYRPDECAVAETAVVTLRQPRTVRELIRVVSRREAGNLEYRRRFGDTSQRGSFSALVRANLSPLRLGDLVVFASIMSLAKARARRKLRSEGPVAWETSREHAATLLVCSGGGHLKQLILLRGRLVPASDSVVWMTFDSPLSRSVLAGEEVVFARYAAPRDLPAIFANTWLAARLLRNRPISRVISTGSSPALSTFFPARAMRIPCHYIESATRNNGPSATGRVLERLPGTHLYTQHEGWADQRWKYRGSVFEGFSAEALGSPPDKIRRAVVTLGTLESRSYGFRRMLEAALRLLPDGCEVLWQTGDTDVTGLPIEARPSVPARELDQSLRQADVVIAHAGTGSALSAFEAGKCPVLVYRQAEFGEHIDDHQLSTATYLSGLGLAVAASPDSLRKKDLLAAAGRRVVQAEHLRPFVLDD